MPSPQGINGAIELPTLEWIIPTFFSLFKPPPPHYCGVLPYHTRLIQRDLIKHSEDAVGKRRVNL
jgi:hypothetical protein